MFLRLNVSQPLALRMFSTQALIALTGSMQLLSRYVLGASVGRTSLEVLSRPAYVVIRIISTESQDT